MSTSTQLYANNARSTLLAGINDVDLSFTVTAGEGAKFPSPTAGQYFLVTLESGSNVEIIKVTSRSGDSFTVDASGRAQEGTTAQSWLAGTLVEMRVTKDTLGRFARYQDRLYEVSSLDSLSAPSDSDSNTYLATNGDDVGNVNVAVRKSASLWTFLSHQAVVVSSGTVSSSTTTSVTSTDIASLISDYSAGRYIIQFTSGALAGQVRHITSAGTNTVSWTTATGSAPAASSTFTIYKSNSKQLMDPVFNTLTSKGASEFNSTVTLDNNQALRWKDSGSTARRIGLVNGSNNIYYGDIDNVLSTSTQIMAGVAINFQIATTTKGAVTSTGFQGALGQTSPNPASVTTFSASGAATFSDTVSLANNKAIQFRNAANSAYLNGIYLDTSDRIVIGSSGAQSAIHLYAAGTFAALVTSTGINSTAIGATTPNTIKATTLETTSTAALGAAPSSYISLYIKATNSYSSGTAYGIVIDTSWASASLTTAAYGMQSTFTLTGSSTVPLGVGYWATGVTTGTATLTEYIGFYVPAISSGTTTRGFRSSIASGTNKWNIFSDGTAQNHFTGNVLIGTTSSDGNKLQVAGTASFSSGVYFASNPTVAGSAVLHASNYNSYSPTLTGGGASGTWSINITGNAVTSSNTTGNSATTSQRTFAYVRTDGVNRGSYGSISISSSAGGYTGIDFTDAATTLMVNTSQNAYGFYRNNTTWVWYVDGNGALQAGSVDWSKLTSVPSLVYNNGSTYNISISGNAATVSNGVYNNGGTYSINITGNSGTVGGYSVAIGASGSTVAVRDVSADLFARYFNQGSANSENPTVSQVMVTNGTDNYVRKASIAHLTSAVQSNASGTWGISISGTAANANTLDGLDSSDFMRRNVDVWATSTDGYNRFYFANASSTYIQGYGGNSVMLRDAGGSDRLIVHNGGSLYANGTMAIGTVDGALSDAKLSVTATVGGSDPIVNVMHTNQTVGTAITYNGIWKSGSTSDLDMFIVSRGNGIIYFNSHGNIGPLSPSSGTVRGAVTYNGDIAACGTSGVVSGNSTGRFFGINAIKAWVNFEGSAGTIRNAYNISSVTKNGDGDYTVNFSIPMGDTNYSFVGTGGARSSGLSEYTTQIVGNVYGTSSFRFYTGHHSYNSTPTVFSNTDINLLVCGA